MSGRQRTFDEVKAEISNQLGEGVLKLLRKTPTKTKKRSTPPLQQVLTYQGIFLEECFNLKPELEELLKNDVFSLFPANPFCLSPSDNAESNRLADECAVHIPALRHIGHSRNTPEEEEYFAALHSWARKFNIDEPWIEKSIHLSLCNWHSPQREPLKIMIAGSAPVRFPQIRINTPGWDPEIYQPMDSISFVDTLRNPEQIARTLVRGANRLSKEDLLASLDVHQSPIAAICDQVVEQLVEQLQEPYQNAAKGGIRFLPQDRGTIRRKMKALAARVVLGWTKKKIVGKFYKDRADSEEDDIAREIQRFTHELASIIQIDRSKLY